MAQISNCLKLLSKIDERDQDALVARLDELQAQGVPAERAQIQAAIDVLTAVQRDSSESNQAPALTSKARAAIKSGVTDTPEFKLWSGGAPVVPLGESHDYRSGEPVVVEALHGTTNSDLTEFKRERANIESDWGAGFYASNAPDDVAMNYANNDGADLTQRIELLAERLASNEFDDDIEAAREEAKKRLTQESPNTMKLYVRMSNPAVQGGPGETFFDYTEEYDEETDSYDEPTGKLVDFVESLRSVADEFDDVDVDGAMTKVWDKAAGDGIGLTDLVGILKSTDSMTYASDRNGGDNAANEVIRRALEDMGFDGVIDTTVYDKFGPKVRRSGQLYDRSGGMKGMDENTAHFIAFEPTQLKSATGNRGTFDPSDANITRSASRLSAGVEIVEVEDGFDAMKDGKRIGRLRDNLPRGAAEQLDENASVDIVKVEPEFKGQGVGSALYEAFNEKHGGRIAPSGKTSPEAWALWKRKYPEKVDAFVDAEAGRIRDGADPMMVVRNISDPAVARRVSEAAGDVLIRSLPRAIIADDLGSLNNDPDYTAAKSGDLDAALRLAGRIVDADLAEQLAGVERPIVAGVVSIEAPGRNAIPQAAAGVLASRLDGELDDLIIQSNAPKRTALGGLDRIFNRPQFAGDVEPGRNYILVDDTITQGGTFAALGRHIQAGGGNVAGVVALSGKQYSAILSVDESTLNTLRKKFGDVENEFEQATGYRYDDLTQSEARYLTSFKPADAVRARILEGAGQGARDGDQGASGQEVVRSLQRPEFFSQLQRSIEGVPDRLATMAAPQWKLWLDANASKLGIKKDEVEWSGVKDYLTLRGKDKVTRDELVAYLADSGVRISETQLGYSPNDTGRAKLAVKYDEAIAAAEAAGTALNPSYIETLDPDKRKPEEQALLDAFKAVNENPEEDYLRQNDPARYNQYVVPGGERYREVLITLPDGRTPAPEQAARPTVVDRGPDENGRGQFDVVLDGEVLDTFTTWSAAQDDALGRQEDENIRRNLAWRKSQPDVYKSSHWDQPNILAHLRVDDRVDADGARVLFLNEVQSDWSSDGRKKGFDKPPMKGEVRPQEGYDPAAADQWEAENAGPTWAVYWEDGTFSGGYDTKEAAEQRLREAARSKSGSVPRGPFVEDTKAYVALALKRAIMLAVEEGHDKIAIITGEQAAGLYSLDKQIDSLTWIPNNDGTFDFEVLKDDATVLSNKKADASWLEDHIGKEFAKKIIDDDHTTLLEKSGRRFIEGEGLKLPATGMRKFYDELIPQVARDVLKKLGGGQLATTKITTDKNGWHITPPSQTASGKWMVKSSDYNSVGLKFDTEAEARAALAEKQETSEQVSFDITDSMREKVASGVPLFSKGRTTGDYGRAYTAEQQEMFKNTGRTVAPQTLIERVKEARSDMWKKMAQGIVDQFRPIRDLGGDAYTLARLSKGSAGAFEALLNYGKLSIVDGAYDADMSGGFIKTIGEPLGAELEDFAWWVASNRAERLAVEDRENLFSRRDIDAGKSLAQGALPKPYTKRDGTTTVDRAEAYADSLVKFNEFNKNVLDIAEQSGLIDGDARKIWENEFYVPFYRVSEEDGQFMGAKIKGGLARQRAFQELKGGSQKLNSDLLANTMKNWAHLIDASAKNRAAKATLEAAEKMNVALEADAETVRQLGKNIGGKGGTVWFMDGGQQRHFVVGDPYLLAAINSLEYAGLRGPLMDALSTTKHWLTVGVTASPAFKVRNLIRDSLQAISVSDLSYNPIANMKDGIKASARDSQTYVSALASGGLIRFGTMMEGNGPERVRRLVQKGVNPSTILDSEAKIKAFYSKTIEPVVDAYNELGNRGEEINRAALYSQLRKQGKSHAEAALLSRDLMDFSMQGTWASIRFLTQVVPFLNARLQGLYKLGRGASEDPRKFAITTGAVAMVSIALMAAYSDDEDWKKREDWDRDTNWWFKIGGVAFRIPKPFEIGAIGTLAERGVELFVNDEFTLKRFLGRVKHIASDNLAMNPVPQAIKPIIDVYANKDAFSGRPIESMGMERLQSEYRYTASTSMVARGASTALNTISRNAIGEESLSPVQIDSMLRGYFGWLGTFIVGGADMLARPLTDEPSRPQADYLKVVTQGIARQIPEPSSKYVSAVYDQAKILEQAYATHRQLIREGKADDAREFAEDNADLLRRYRLVERVKGAQSQINRTIREIERSDKDPKTKREEIQALRERQSRIAAEVY